MKQRKFLYCHHCGNLLGLIHDAGVPISCCGELMQEPNLIDIKDGCRIHADGQTTVVDMNFPRDGIPQWVYLQTDIGGQRKKTEGFARVAFHLADEEEARVAYCYFSDRNIGGIEC